MLLLLTLTASLPSAPPVYPSIDPVDSMDGVQVGRARQQADASRGIASPNSSGDRAHTHVAASLTHTASQPLTPIHNHHTTPTGHTRTTTAIMASTPAAAAAAAFKGEGHSCFVIGFTGEVGKELVKVGANVSSVKCSV